MLSNHTYKPTGPFDQRYVTKVYIPSAILIATVAIFKIQWTPFAIAAAAALAGWQFFENRTPGPIKLFLTLTNTSI